MARIRTIKPEFFTSEDIVELDPIVRLLYIALWCEADKEGRLSWKPKTFKMRYFPADTCDIELMCDALVTRGLVCLYGDSFAYIPSFKSHQHINPREKESELPTPNIDACGTRRDASVTVDARAGRKEGREGKGRVVASKRETTIPEDFSISESVRAWAVTNNHWQLDAHLTNFVDSCKAKGYKYIDWDAAFRKAISANWAKVTASPETKTTDEIKADIRYRQLSHLCDGDVFEKFNAKPSMLGWYIVPETDKEVARDWCIANGCYKSRASA